MVQSQTSLKLTTLVLLGLALGGFTKDLTNSAHNLWPLPKYYTSGFDTLVLGNLDEIKVVINAGKLEPLVMDNLQAYKGYVNESGTYGIEATADPITLTVEITDTVNVLMKLDTDESYHLEVNGPQISIKSQTYAGFLRGLETLSQTITEVKDKDGDVINHQITHTPVIVTDEPRFAHRGVMVDTSRHFISKDVLMKIMDGMMFAKLNVFHWHITDTDSFPIYMPSHPNLSKNGAFSEKETYSQQDVVDLTLHAARRGIRIIPELDSPAHLNSWHYAPEFKDIVTCVAKEDPSHVGQIDPTQDVTYELLKDLIGDIEDYFPWELIHFGADEVVSDCWKTDKIEKFMKDHNLSSFGDLFNYYVKREKTLMSPSKTAMYWINPSTSELNFDEDDVLQFWGSTSQFQDIAKQYPNNRFVLSNDDYYYLDWGYGTPSGGVRANYKTWKDIYYFDLDNSMYGAKVLGLEVCEWGELHNDAVIFDRVFPRSAAMAEPAWSAQGHDYDNLYSIFNRLNAWTWRIIKRGVPSGPISSGYCENHSDVCFGGL
mmetsp:Transcript_36360/g.41447  ORF Transcript_36360/g.41447 Transcript_36360/m.41447 type:complete len:543 (-) Transcript_36360:1211-2839(-)